MAKKAAPKAAAPAPAPAPAKGAKSAPAKGAEKDAPAAKGAKSAAADKPKAKESNKPKASTKSEIYTSLAEKTKVPRKDISAIFDALNDMIKDELSKKGGAETFVIPGLLKLKVVNKEATKEKKGINPFTKEPMTFKAKPARRVIKAVLLKSLREMI